MEKIEFMESVEKLKLEVLEEIRKILPNGSHNFSEPFYIHYIDGEVATTDVCESIEVQNGEVKIYYNKEAFFGSVGDFTCGEQVLQYDTQSFADILGYLKNDIRKEKLSELKKLIEDAGGKLTFDGSFTFTGIQVMAGDSTSYFDDTRLFGIEVKDGEISIDDMWDGDSYQNDVDYIDFDYLDKIIEYVKGEVEKKKSFVYIVTITEYEANTNYLDTCTELYNTLKEAKKRVYEYSTKVIDLASEHGGLDEGGELAGNNGFFTYYKNGDIAKVKYTKKEIKNK